MSTRLWHSEDTYHGRGPTVLTIGGWAANDDFGLTVEVESENADHPPANFELDQGTAIDLAVELLLRAGVEVDLTEYIFDIVVRYFQLRGAERVRREPDA